MREVKKHRVCLRLSETVFECEILENRFWGVRVKGMSSESKKAQAKQWMSLIKSREKAKTFPSGQSM